MSSELPGGFFAEIFVKIAGLGFIGAWASGFFGNKKNEASWAATDANIIDPNAAGGNVTQPTDNSIGATTQQNQTINPKVVGEAMGAVSPDKLQFGNEYSNNSNLARKSGSVGIEA